MEPDLYKAFYSEVDDQMKDYETGTVTYAGNIEFSTRKTAEQINHYISSRYTDGRKDNKDKYGRRRPFRNIGNAIVDIEYRAKSIDTSAIEYHASDGDYAFSLAVDKEFKNYFRDSDFPKFKNEYQRKKTEYGSVLIKKCEEDGELKIEVVDWDNISVDQHNIKDGTKIERSYFSPVELKKMRGIWDDENIALALQEYKKQKKWNVRGIEILDIEGEFDSYLFEDIEPENSEIKLYNHICAQIGAKKFPLFHTELKETRYKYDRRKRIEGRDWGLGVWEECFEPQIWINEAVIAEKFAMDLAGKVIIKTTKQGDVPNALTMEDGEVIKLEPSETMESMQLAPSALPVWQTVIDSWFINMQRDQSAFAAMTGEEQKAGTPFAAQALQATQAASIFNERRQDDGLFLNEVLLDWVAPFISKKVNKEHKLTAAHSFKELEVIAESIVADISAGQFLYEDKLVTPEMQQEQKENIAKQFNLKQGKVTLNIPAGYITTEKIRSKGRFDITDEMFDDQRALNAIASTLQFMDPTDPRRGVLIQQMMEIAGIGGWLSPKPTPEERPQEQPQDAQTPPKVGTAQKSRVQEALPESQQNKLS